MDYILSFIAGGLTQATWWQIVVFTLVMTHITIVSVTVFLHRSGRTGAWICIRPSCTSSASGSG